MISIRRPRTRRFDVRKCVLEHRELLAEDGLKTEARDQG